MSEQSIPSGSTREPEVHVHNNITVGDGRGWGVLFTLLFVAGTVVIAWQLSLGPWKEVVSSGLTIFTTTLVSYMFKAGILRLPDKGEEDDLAFTKSTLRRVYDEITAAIVKSSMLRLVLFAAAYTVGFLLLRGAVSTGLTMISSRWMAVGVGLIAGSLVVAQDRILASLRRMNLKKGGDRR